LDSQGSGDAVHLSIFKRPLLHFFRESRCVDPFSCRSEADNREGKSFRGCGTGNVTRASLRPFCTRFSRPDRQRLLWRFSYMLRRMQFSQRVLALKAPGRQPRSRVSALACLSRKLLSCTYADFQAVWRTVVFATCALRNTRCSVQLCVDFVF
jgi:hypothetical protein